MGENYIKIVLPLKSIHLDTDAIQCKTVIIILQSSLGDNPPRQSIIVKSDPVRFNSDTPSLNISKKFFAGVRFGAKRKLENYHKFFSFDVPRFIR